MTATKLNYFLSLFTRSGKQDFSSQKPSLLDPYLASQLISGAIVTGGPFFAGRIGFLEGVALDDFEAKGKVSNTLRMRLRSNAGLFPSNESQFKYFYHRYIEGIDAINLMAVMENKYQFNLIERHPSSRIYCALSSLEPYLHPYPWSQHLAGRSVLVVHPFKESIQSQYENYRKQLFTNVGILPKFKLTVIRPPQTVTTNTGGFFSWSDALHDLEERVKEVEFEIAIIGCGAYGFPLGAFIKSLGKVAIHMGGATQLLFGVSGGRWRNKPAFRAIMTETWRPPLECERPEGWEKIEDGCYW